MNGHSAGGRVLASLLVLAFFAGVFPCRTSAFSPALDSSESYRSGVYYSRLTGVNLTGDTRTDITAIARSQIGYHEGGSEDDLSGGSLSEDNFTEYGRCFGQTQDAWCAMFIWWCAAQAGVPDSVINKTAWAKVSAFGCPYYSFDSYTDLQPGDIVFVGQSGSTVESHVGIITAVTDDRIITAEGNLGDIVAEVAYNRSTGQKEYGGWNILYIGVPDYLGSGYTSRKIEYVRVTSNCTARTKPGAGRNAAKHKKGEELLLLARSTVNNTEWFQVELGLNSEWISAENAEVFTVWYSNGTTAPTAQTASYATTATTAASALNTVTAPTTFEAAASHSTEVTVWGEPPEESDDFIAGHAADADIPDDYETPDDRYQVFSDFVEENAEGIAAIAALFLMVIITAGLLVRSTGKRK